MEPRNTATQALYEPACHARGLEAHFHLNGKVEAHRIYAAQARELEAALRAMDTTS